MGAEPVGVIERRAPVGPEPVGATTAVTPSTPAAAPGAAPTGAPVRVSNLSRRFGRRQVLSGLDLDLGPGDFVTVLGRSGTGKTTLLRALAGLDKEVEGAIEVPAARAVVFQDPRLLPWARVLDNVVLGLKGHGPAERGRRALAEVGLAEHAADWPKTLSGGEAQRVALARAFVRQPELLLLDEPFGALDALTRIRMHRLLGDLCTRYRPAVVLVTHDVDEAVLLADRVVVLEAGRISAEEDVDLDRPRSRSHPAFIALRSRLLGALGVDEADR